MHRALLAALAAVTLLVVGSPTPALAADEIVTSASSTYRVVPDDGEVRVKVTQKVTNRIPNTTESYDCSYQYFDYWDYSWVTVPRTCSNTTRYYVNDAYLWVEAGAKDLKVTSNGGSVKVKKDGTTDNFRSYALTFPRIYNGQTRTITATYTIPGGAPRSDTALRVNGAYFDIWAISQPTDTAKVTIKVPEAFDVDTYGGPVTEKVADGVRTLSSGGVDDPTAYFVGITGTNPSGFVKEQVTTSGGRTVSILGWPGDDEWMTAIRGETAAAIPELEALIGQPLPGTGDIEVRETADSVLGEAYVATFDPEAQVAQVSEDFGEAGTVTHELAHAWFNDDLFAERWLSEGYASWIERATGTVSASCVAPVTYPGEGSSSLTSWRYAGPRATLTEFAVVAYQYDAACALVSRAAETIGVDRMRDVIGVLATPASAYEGVSDRVPGAPVGWRDWLDAVDERGLRATGMPDSDVVAALLTEFGIASEADLQVRAQARSAFAELRDGPNDWAVPDAVARPMAYWEFDDAQRAIAFATEAYTMTARTESLLPSITASESPIRASYEAATDAAALVEARDRASDQLEAATVVATATGASLVEFGPIEQIGLLGVDLPTLTADATIAVQAFDLAAAHSRAEEIHAIIAGAATSGLIRIGIALVVIALAVVAVLVVRRRRRPTPVVTEIAAAPVPDGPLTLGDSAGRVNAPVTFGADVRPIATDAFVAEFRALVDDERDRP